MTHSRLNEAPLNPFSNLPDSKYFLDLEALEAQPPLTHLFEKLVEPIAEFTGRKSKKIRAKLVLAGSKFVGQQLFSKETTEQNVSLCQMAIEYLHAGSLMIDDIQDDSPFRRGRPAMHRQCGIPRAITQGNWLYMWAMRLIRQVSLPNSERLRLLDKFSDCLELAHYGQCLDVSVPMDKLPQQEVSNFCEWVTLQKTGIMTAVALQIGAICNGGDDDLLERLRSFGLKFGKALQNYDDLGNVIGKVDPEKQWEDLQDLSPSWVWAFAADNLSKTEYQQFIKIVRDLPASKAVLNLWMQRNSFIEQAETLAARDLNNALVEQETLPRSHAGQLIINQLAETIKNAYTK